MNPNLALRRLADRVRPHDVEMQAIRPHLIIIERKLARAFPRSHVVQIGSHSRGTAIAVHSPIDILAVLPRVWATWGGRPIPPDMIIQRLAEVLSHLASTPSIRPDGRVVLLDFGVVNHTIKVLPGFFRRRSHHYPVFSIPNDDHRWMETSPGWHNALFSQANMRSGGKLRVISRLIKAWGFANTPLIGISGLYVDMLLATSADMSVGKSYGECLLDFFRALIECELHSLKDPTGLSRSIVACASSSSIERLYAATKTAYAQAESALIAQASGNKVAAKRQWRALFKRGI
jgi:Second Messenger Oligonucleotide or Dinucleotide Synthetase domain